MKISAGIFFGGAILNLILAVIMNSFQMSVIHLLLAIFNVLVTYKNGKMGHVSLEEVVGNNKVVGAASGNTKESNIRKIQMDDDLIQIARDLGMCLGD